VLVAAQITATAPDDDTSRWVASIDDALHAKLAKVGLVSPRQKRSGDSLAGFLTLYVTSRDDVKPNTRRNLLRASAALVGHFGSARTLASISAGEADEFRRQLRRPKKEGGAGLGENTARRICGRSRQFFRAAQRNRLIAENPFADMTCITVQANRQRDYFITREDAAKVLDACPDSQWRLLFALSRYGGLRCPSEHLALRWGDVDWERGRIAVSSPKTAHHEGKSSRSIPLFPELRPYLEAAWDEAAPGTEFVITRYRDTNSNLRTQLERIL